MSTIAFKYLQIEKGFGIIYIENRLFLRCSKRSLILSTIINKGAGSPYAIRNACGRCHRADLYDKKRIRKAPHPPAIKRVDFFSRTAHAGIFLFSAN